MKRNKGRRTLYGLIGAVMVATAIGSVAAKENKPYKAPELRLLQGTEDYDLTEGITYNKNKYELMVEDTGEFDIEVLGKYEVEYSLTPVDAEDEITTEEERENREESTAGKESKEIEEESTAEPESGAIEEESTVEPESKETEEESTTEPESEETEEENTIEPESEETEEESTAELEREETEEESAAEAESKETEEEGTTEAESKETEEEGTTEPESEETEEESTTEQETTKAEETTAAGKLDDLEATIYFTRTVRVVASLAGSSIEFDEGILQFSTDEVLYDLIAGKESDFSKATSSNAKVEEFMITEEEWITATSSNAVEEEDAYDGITEGGVEYSLVLKDKDKIVGDAFLADAEGKKIKKAEISIKDDSDLKAAVRVAENEDGTPYILGLYPGTYTVELVSEDPETGEEITGEREIEIIQGNGILFHAPALYLGTRNTEYDLTEGVTAVDEADREITPIYVVNEDELLKAAGKEATPSEAVEENGGGARK